MYLFNNTDEGVIVVKRTSRLQHISNGFYGQLTHCASAHTSPSRHVTIGVGTEIQAVPHLIFLVECLRFLCVGPALGIGQLGHCLGPHIREGPKFGGKFF